MQCSRMRALRKLPACLLLLATGLGFASSPVSAKDFASSLKKKTLLLRGAFSENHLTFSSDGSPQGPATPGPFWLGAIKIEHVSLTNNDLVIEGHRVLLLSISKEDPPAVSDIRVAPAPLGSIKIVVKRDPAHPEELAATVLKVLALNVNDALSGKTERERNAVLSSLPSFAPPASTGAAESAIHAVPAQSDESPIYKPGRGVTAPRLVFSVDPEFTEEARALKINGIIVLSLIVDKSGRPAHIRMVRSLDPGLDQNAIVAVSQYRFTPATLSGEPVVTQVTVEVNFKIY
jgi:TonB family protein